MTKISVIIPVFNGEDFIEKAIESILCQSFSDFELIVLDDGSTDNTLSVINLYKSDRRLKLIINEKNIGFTRSLNKAITHAKGEYIARLDADDISCKERLRIQFEMAKMYGKNNLYVSDFHRITYKGEIINHNKFINFFIKKPSVDGLLRFRPFFPHSSYFFAKSLWNEVGGYDERYIYSQDTEFALKVRRNGAKIIPNFNKLIQIRQGTNNISFEHALSQQIFGIMAIIEHYKGEKIYKFLDVYKKVEYLYVNNYFLSIFLKMKKLSFANGRVGLFKKICIFPIYILTPRIKFIICKNFLSKKDVY